MIDQHLIELTPNYSGPIVSGNKMCGKKKNSRTLSDSTGTIRQSPSSLRDSDASTTPNQSTQISQHSNATLSTNQRTHLYSALAEAGLATNQTPRSRVSGAIHGSSDATLISQTRHRRRATDIDSLSPEVLAALQSTFGGKLDEIRSRIQAQQLLSSPSSSPSPPLTPPIPLIPPSSPVPPPQIASATTAVVRMEGLTFVERLRDVEGPYMLLAYFCAIFLSGFILTFTDEAFTYDLKMVECGERVNTLCANLYGRILSVGFLITFLVFALLLFVLDVSFCVFSFLTAADDYLRHICKKETRWAKDFSADGTVKVPSGAELVLIFTIELGFIFAASSLLWISKISTSDPLFTMCENRLRVLWMFGLMVIGVLILFSAMNSFKDPPHSLEYILGGAKKVVVVFCLLLLSTTVYRGVTLLKSEGNSCVPDRPHGNEPHYEGQYYCGSCGQWLLLGPDSIRQRQFSLTEKGGTYLAMDYSDRPCFSTGENKFVEELGESERLTAIEYQCKQCDLPEISECTVNKVFQRCLDWGALVDEDSHGQLCFSCKPKEAGLSRESERCMDLRFHYLQCLCPCGRLLGSKRNIRPTSELQEWLPSKLRRSPEAQKLCEPNTQQCEWPRTKRTLPYERMDKCWLVYSQCDWSRLKQIQPYRNGDRCFPAELIQCEWPWLKQVQHFQRNEKCDALYHYLHRCDWPLLKRIQSFEDKSRCPLKKPELCDWLWVKQIQLFQHSEKCEAKYHNFDQCDWPLMKRIQSFEEKSRCPVKKLTQCDWPWVKQIQLVNPEACYPTRDHHQCGEV